MVYVDTSVLVPLFLNEPHSVAAAEWYACEKSELVAAAWCIPEFATALGIKQRPPIFIARPDWCSIQRAPCAPATPCTSRVPKRRVRSAWQPWMPSCAAMPPPD
jgi:hypothetical protein